MPEAPDQTAKERTDQGFQPWIFRHCVEPLLFTLIWTSYAYFYRATGDNEATRLDQLRALVEDHTLKIDQYWWNSAEVIHLSG